MKNLLSLFICLSLVTFYSCGDDDNEKGNENEITLNARIQYSTDNDGINTQPDTGAKVFIFYDFDCNNPNGFIYQGNGKYIKDGDMKNYDQVATIDTDGNLTIKRTYNNKTFTVVSDSKHYTGQFKERYYDDSFFNEDVSFSYIFKPQ